MGYSTRFQGEFSFSKTLTLEQHNILSEVCKIDHRDPVLPKAAKGFPGIWCDWKPNEDGTGLVWNEGEKTHEYMDWLKYLIAKYLMPWKIKLNGRMIYQGSEIGDVGTIFVKDNVVTKKALKL